MKITYPKSNPPLEIKVKPILGRHFWKLWRMRKWKRRSEIKIETRGVCDVWLLLLPGGKKYAKIANFTQCIIIIFQQCKIQKNDQNGSFFFYFWPQVAKKSRAIIHTALHSSSKEVVKLIFQLHSIFLSKVCEELFFFFYRFVFAMEVMKNFLVLETFVPKIK